MILRYWRGWTTAQNADAYREIVTGTVLPHIAGLGLTGYRGAYVMRREVGAVVEFATFSMFDSRVDERCAHYDLRLSPEERAGS